MDLTDAGDPQEYDDGGGEEEEEESIATVPPAARSSESFEDTASATIFGLSPSPGHPPPPTPLPGHPAQLREHISVVSAQGQRHPLFATAVAAVSTRTQAAWSALSENSLFRKNILIGPRNGARPATRTSIPGTIPSSARRLHAASGPARPETTADLPIPSLSSVFPGGSAACSMSIVDIFLLLKESDSDEERSAETEEN
jgi:hypothetical protein